jgi:transposase
MERETLVPDDLWALIAPLLPPRPPHRKGGRPWLPDRRALCGIMFVLQTGCGWNALPRALGCGSGSTCWRRLRDWQAAGVWYALHRAILDQLGQLGALDWSRVSVDSASLRAKKGAKRWDRTRPTGASRGPNVTWPSIARGCRWPPG